MFETEMGGDSLVLMVSGNFLLIFNVELFLFNRMLDKT